MYHGDRQGKAGQGRAGHDGSSRTCLGEQWAQTKAGDLSQAGGVKLHLVATVETILDVVLGQTWRRLSSELPTKSRDEGEGESEGAGGLWWRLRDNR